MKKILKRIGIGLLLILGTILLMGFLFVSTSDQFGGTATADRLSRYQKSPNYKDGEFINNVPFNLEMDCHSIEKMIKDRWNPHPNLVPDHNIEVLKVDSLDIAAYADTTARVTWFGHSTVLVEMDGKRILFDPHFGQYASPHHWLGVQRYHEEMPMSAEKLPAIDAVIISHDHYDHLDYETIVALNEKTEHFYVPLGVGNHLAQWGVSWEKIQEMDWWEETQLDELLIACTPSKHMSGRGFNDQFSTLWASWVVGGTQEKIYFSGDGGYSPRFKKIAERYGPFDLAFLECGQYNKLWSDVHLMPEQTAQAGMELKAELVMPIHWGSFTLATHSWTDPVERLTKKAEEIGLPVTTPRIGECFLMDAEIYPESAWWVN